MDTEYTNGNYYLGDIFEIALLSESSGYVFHSYINTRQHIPRYVKNLCNVTTTLVKRSPPFREVMNDLIQFIKREEEEEAVNTTRTVLIAHGGYLYDYPLLLTNYMRRNNNIDEYDSFVNAMEQYAFIDSIQVLQRRGYRKTSLDVLANIDDTRIHSAAKDVEILRDIVKKYKVCDDISSSYTIQDILRYIQTKLPIQINELYELAAEASSRECLENTLYRHAVKKTALNVKQISKIASMYFIRKL